MSDSAFHDLFDLGADATPYRQLTSDYVSAASLDGAPLVKVAPEALTLLAAQAYIDCQHLLRPGHLRQLRKILDDPEASDNDRFVAFDLLKNANIAAGKVLPMCQDTGTAIVMGKKGQGIWTGGGDEAAISAGIRRTYTETNLRYSQVAPLSLYEEVNTGDNLPAQIDLYAAEGNAYKFLFIAKGGGSANKTFLFQQTKAVLNPKSLLKFLDEKIRTLGTSACPPYHLSIVIGGTSAEMNLKTVKLASCRYLDGLPTQGNRYGQAFRDVEFEQEVLALTRDLGIGAQFGGKYFCHDVRVIRLPRHGASLPIGIGVSCAADRQILGKIDAKGVFLEALETDPSQYLPDIDEAKLGGDVVRIDLNRPMAEIRRTLSRYPIKTRLSLTGPLIVARDIAHAKLKDALDQGEALPNYFKDHAIYYAGPAKTPAGYASGSFGPTTAGRMDSYVDQFMAAGGSFVTLAKGNRGAEVRQACKRHGGFYLGSIGGPAARLARDCIKKVETLAFPELGMEAIWRIEVEDFPAFIVIDDKGNDFSPTLPEPMETAPKDEIVEFVSDQLRSWAPVSARRLFSGWGLYRSDTIFCIILRDTPYFRVDDGNRADYENAGAHPFQYNRSGGPKTVMPYYEVPADILDDSDELGVWAGNAYAAALKAATLKAAKINQKAARKKPVKSAARPRAVETAARPGRRK